MAIEDLRLSTLGPRSCAVGDAPRSLRSDSVNTRRRASAFAEPDRRLQVDRGRLPGSKSPQSSAQIHPAGRASHSSPCDVAGAISSWRSESPHDCGAGIRPRGWFATRLKEVLRCPPSTRGAQQIRVEGALTVSGLPRCEQILLDDGVNAPIAVYHLSHAEIHTHRH